ncbi:MAG: acyl-CoA dehydrogenase [Solirubrobacterales bacterium]|nr:acyl-CoA dehydrogenase [Solirubrobacterales bacterium]
MSHYKSNLRDLQFNLFEALKVDDVLATGNYEHLDGDTVRTMLSEAARVAEGPLSASFAETDRNPPTFDPETGTVTLPEDFKAAVRSWSEGDWHRVGLSEDVGGVPAPPMVTWAINEFVLGAQPAALMYLAGASFSGILHGLGDEEQKHWAQLAVEREWGSTMVLTEPDAGSDVGAGRTKATEQEDGTFHIEGVKRFITSGDSGDLFENIFHLVLARIEGAAPGTKGLSLFFVPKFHFDTKTGEPGERNGVFVTGLEHKMGLKASATCDVAFGDNGIPAVGWLVGGDRNGIAQMFKVIEHARMMVGTKAIATLSTGYLNALEYAKERVQGADLTQMTDKSAPRVSIMHHPDVRRALMRQKAYAEGLRSVYLYTAAFQDVTSAEIVFGMEGAMAHKVNDLLLPIVKGVGSERAYEVLAESLQTYGGSGYLQDYPLEQYIRDAKIDSLYEGTTAIQAQDFFFRKIARDKGEAIGWVMGQMQASIDRDGDDGLKESWGQFATALGDVQAMAGSLTQYLIASQEDPKSLYKVGLGSRDFLMAFGDLLIGWLLLDHAEIALKALAGNPTAEGDKAFYEGKVAVATFFSRTVLPGLSAVKETIATIDNDVMELAEASF